MLDDFLLRAMLAGVGLSLATGPLGAFIVWRRLAYFGDATAHAAVLGVALSLAFSVSIAIGTVAVALVVAALVSNLSNKRQAADAVTGVIAHGGLALGLVVISFVNNVRVDLNSLLFGDILTVGKGDLATIWIGSALVLALLIWRWSELLTATVNEELAASAGINPKRERLVITLATALVIALALKVVGALLITAMLIVPAAAARGFANTPERMAGIAIVIGAFSSIGGILASLYSNAPTGPSIVVVALLVFIISRIVMSRQND